MSVTSLPFRPLTRERRSMIAGAIAVLTILTLIGTAPQPAGPVAVGTSQPQSMTSTTVTPAPGDGLSFAEIFAQTADPVVESSGEGLASAVAVADRVPDVPVPGEPAAPGTPATATVPADVVLVQPTLTVRGVPADAVDDIAALDGVAAAAAAQVGQVEVEVADRTPVTLTVAAVDPLAFRPFTPQLTAEEPTVWERIIAGDAAFTHDAGNRLGAALGSEVAVGATGERLRVGVHASNGIPSVADAIVSTDRLPALGLTGDTTIYVAVAGGTSPSTVSDAISATWAGSAVERLTAPESQQAFLTGSAAASFFEPFSYVDHGDGLITIDPAWVARNIETRRLPIFTGNVTCHRQMLVQLEGALAEVEAAGLASLIDTTDYGGCWVARHIDWRPDRPLSMHAWGLAVDFNVRTNGLGRTPTMDPRIVAIFDRWGFVWGGRWSRPDGMHFELGAVLQAPTGQAVGTLTS